jgi:DNA-binding transcriptional LysR family regulator
MAFDEVTLACFLAVAETHSFTRAAQRIGRTQSAASQQIQRLESELGTVLFQRDKGMTLTQAGEIFRGYATRIVSLQNEALERFKEPELEGEVRFGLPEDFAAFHLAELLAEFVRSHPRIQMSTECDLTLNLFERFKKKDLDIVLVKMNRPEDFPNGVDIWSEKLVWVGDDSILQQAQSIPLVLSPFPCVYRQQALQSLEEAQQHWRLTFTSPSYTSTVAAVEARLGVTVLPRTMVPKNLPVISDKQLPPLADTHISILKHRNDNPAINSLEHFLVSTLQKGL